jgi:uncharacterized membrane protein HdeD (DUF308 family)
MIMVQGFLLGIIVTASLASGAFFLRYWRRTRDELFLAFGAAFIIEGINRIGFLFVDKPNEGSPAIYVVRLLAFALILAANVRKNRAPAR